MQPYGGVNLRLSAKKLGSHNRVPSDEALMSAHRKYAAHQPSSGQAGSTQQAWQPPPAAPPAPGEPREPEAAPEVGPWPTAGELVAPLIVVCGVRMHACKPRLRY